MSTRWFTTQSVVRRVWSLGTFRALFTLLIVIAAVHCTLSNASAAPPNIVVILTDDQGYADISLNPQHPKEVSTPHMDSLARESVFFTQAYLSGNVCSPTRAGLMLGRYQQRVGVYSAGEGGSGFDPTLPIFPSYLPPQYISTALGKWHLGPTPEFWPTKQGFDVNQGGHVAGAPFKAGKYFSPYANPRLEDGPQNLSKSLHLCGLWKFS